MTEALRLLAAKLDELGNEAEERVPGEAVFRVQTLGDIRHLTQGNEIPSASGFYGDVSAW